MWINVFHCHKHVGLIKLGKMCKSFFVFLFFFGSDVTFELHLALLLVCFWKTMKIMWRNMNGCGIKLST